MRCTISGQVGITVNIAFRGAVIVVVVPVVIRSLTPRQTILWIMKGRALRRDGMVDVLAKMGLAAFEVSGAVVVLLWEEDRRAAAAPRQLAAKPLAFGTAASLEQFGIAQAVRQRSPRACG